MNSAIAYLRVSPGSRATPALFADQQGFQLAQ
jgi:hypothetical protein